MEGVGIPYSQLTKWGPWIVKKETQGWAMTMTMTNHKNTKETFLKSLVKRCETEEIYENRVPQ